MSYRVCAGEREVGDVWELREEQSVPILLPYRLRDAIPAAPQQPPVSLAFAPGQGVRRATPAAARPSPAEDPSGVLRGMARLGPSKRLGRAGKLIEGKTQRSDHEEAWTTSGRTAAERLTESAGEI